MYPYENKQVRDRQPSRAGGNSDAKQSEKQGQKRGLAIGSDVALKAASQCEKVRGGGNAAVGDSREKHDQPKAAGKRFAGGVEVKYSDIPEDIQVDDRGKDSSGNCSKGGVEKSGQKKASRLDMSVRRFD